MGNVWICLASEFGYVPEKDTNIPLLPFCNCFLKGYLPIFLKTSGHVPTPSNKPAAMKGNRFVIYPKDIQLVTGRSESYARGIIRAIKKRLGKQKHQFVTYEEFCEFSGLSLQDLTEHLR